MIIRWSAKLIALILLLPGAPLASGQASAGPVQPGFIRGTVTSRGVPVAEARVTCSSMDATPTGPTVFVRVYTSNNGAFTCNVPSGETYHVVADKDVSLIPQEHTVRASRGDVSLVLFPMVYGSAATLERNYAFGALSGKSWSEELASFERFSLEADTAAKVPITIAASRTAAEQSCAAAKLTRDPRMENAWCNRVYVLARSTAATDLMFFQVTRFEQ